jgi:plastocyanin
MSLARSSFVVALAVAATLATILSCTFTARADASVAIAGFAFAPGNLTVSVGDTVTWTHNDGDIPHTVTSSGGGPLSSGNMSGGDVYAFTFEEAGTYQYFCAIHPDMTATVNVQAANDNGDAPVSDEDTPEPAEGPPVDDSPAANGNGEAATPAPPATGDDDDGGNTGLIVGIIVVVVVVALAGGFLVLRRRQAT